MKQYQDKAMLVNLCICQWTARKHDKAVSQKIEQEHQAHKAGRYNKTLIDKAHLSAIQTIAGEARDYLYTHTLPWGDNGDRLLAAVKYSEFTAQLRSYRAQYSQAVSEFVRSFPEYKEEARKRLNGMYREEDYPALDILLSKFSMEVQFMAIADTTDFRVQVDQEEVESLRTSIETEINNRFHNATKDIWQRIREAVGHMVERLSNKDAVFRNTLVSNIRELVDVLPSLNFTADPNIADVIESMKALLVDPDQLRNSIDLRQQKATEAKAILDKVADFLG